MGDLHGGGHSVPFLGLPVLAQGDEHARVPVALVGVVVVGEQYLLELALISEERLGGRGNSVRVGLCLAKGPRGASGPGLPFYPSPTRGWQVRCQSPARVRRGAGPAHSSGLSSHLPNTWQPEKSHLHCVHLQGCGPAGWDTSQGLPEGFPMAPFAGAGGAHSGMAQTSLFLSWGCDPRSGPALVTGTAPGHCGEKGALPVL